MALNALGRVCLRLGLFGAGESQHRRALDIAEQTSFYWCVASDLVILAAQDFTGKPVARVHLPARVPLGFHGSWVPDV
ncbi:carotenoid oxygenase family protein [Micromonospora sp. NPDC005413]|uniref:carotenoid oxygenase family protein n=1 Tax=Micromonospora sp. NPDC005413 TaxID=3154563 RepID=UPI0033A8C15D